MSARPTPTIEQLKAAKRRARSLVMSTPGVNGVGIGAGTIRVYVLNSDAAATVPATVDDIDVEVVVTGPITVHR